MQQAALTQDWPGGRLPEFIREMTTLAAAVISRDGILIDANLGFFNLLPHSMSAPDILDVRELFLNPRFDQFATRRARRTGGPVYRGILNLGHVRGYICSLQGTIYALNDAVLMAAEHEVAGLELLRTRVLQVNEELVEEQRKLAAAVREITRQKQLLSQVVPGEAEAKSGSRGWPAGDRREHETLYKCRRVCQQRMGCVQGNRNGVAGPTVCCSLATSGRDCSRLLVRHRKQAIRRAEIMAFQGTRSQGSIAFVDTWASATQSETMPIPDLLRGLEAIVVAVIGRDGSLQDANRGFLLLMTGGASPPELSDVRALFVNPRFEEFVGRRTNRFESTIHRGVLSFGTPGGKITSLRGSIYWHGQDFVVVAEHEIGRLESLRTTVLELQDDLAMKQRHIMHLEHRVAQLQELADAALGDRDALLDALARRVGGSAQ